VAQYVVTSSQADVQLQDQNYFNNATPDAYSREHANSQDLSLTISATNSIVSSPKSQLRTNQSKKNLYNLQSDKGTPIQSKSENPSNYHEG